MLISIDWIKDFVKLPELSAKELGEKFTLSSAEVEDVVLVGAHLDKVKIAEIISIRKHPEADKLNLVTFNFGGKENKEVVCGASNVRVGLKTFYAPLGVTLPNGMTLEPKKIRGFLSEGMLCSEEELGFADSSEGIMDLPADSAVGTTVAEYYSETPDVLLDVDNKSLTHRPDMWGHYGIAREFAAAHEVALERPYDEKWLSELRSKCTDDAAPMNVSIENDCAGISYFGLSVNNVTVKESPSWLKKRLTAVGLRPINNIVDISNYVMLELGMPLHIFDRSKIEGDCIKVRSLESEETFVTLDEVERSLVPGDTVIADSKKPLVIAGIMGGLNSGVDDSTKDIFIEVANWKAAKVRTTSTRLGLRTDSSQRYEKTLDSLQCERTLFRTLEMVLKECPEAKVVGPTVYDGVDLSSFSPLVIETSTNKICSILGTEVSTERILKILSSLDFAVEQNSDSLKVTVPSFRSTKDVECEADIIEEVGRMIGYDNITPESPKLDISPVRLSVAAKLHRNLKDYLVYHARSFEVNTYPMIGAKLLEKSSWTEAADIKIINALSEGADRMRPNLVPSFLEMLALNSKHQEQGRFFELGRFYKGDKKSFCHEESQLAVAFFDRSENTYMDLLNNVERMLNSCNVPFDFCEKHPKFKSNAIDESWVGLHPFEFTNIRVMGKIHGSVFSIHPMMLRNFKIKGNVSIALLNLGSLEQRPMKDKTKYKPLAKFPGSSFDWSVVADSDTAVAAVLAPLKKLKIKELNDVHVVGTFDLGEGKKSITLRASFIDPEKTLGGDFITESSNLLVETLNKAGFPLKE
jgi:phenylalanyl-tRNA synthetase beta chain